MKTTALKLIVSALLAFLGLSASADESQPRNQYSNSLMFSAPPVYEDPNYKNASEQHEQFCRDLQKQINELKNQPVRRSAARERYQKECVGN